MGGQEAGNADGQQLGSMPMTNSALKLAKWMQVYGELLRCCLYLPCIGTLLLLYYYYYIGKCSVHISLRAESQCSMSTL